MSPTEPTEPLLPAPEHEDLIEATNPPDSEQSEQDTSLADKLKGIDTQTLKTMLANNERRLNDIGDNPSDPEDQDDKRFSDIQVAAIKAELESRGELTTAS